jgi:hypothetical protein
MFNVSILFEKFQDEKIFRVSNCYQQVTIGSWSQSIHHINMLESTVEKKLTIKKIVDTSTRIDILFTYSKCPIYIQLVVFGPCENSLYLTVSYEALGSLFISSYFSASLPHFPFFLFLFNPKHCFRRHNFFQNAKLVYAKTQESTEHQFVFL